jgi:hypothetical protein
MIFRPLLTFFILVFSLSTCYVTAQADLRIGEWKAHMPYTTGLTVTQSDTRVYYGTEYALVAISKDDSTDVDFFSKIDGLSDVAPSWIRYHKGLETLIIGYRNGNIDLLDANGITNINAVLRNTSIQGDKRINHIYTDDGTLAFLTTPFGLLILDLVTGQFQSTVFTPTPALAFTKHNGLYYLAVEGGLYAYDTASGNLVENFNQWMRITDPKLPANYTAQFVSVHNDKLYAGLNGQLYRQVNDTLDLMYELPGYSVSYISNESENLIVGYFCDSGCLGKVAYFRDNDDYWNESGDHCAPRPVYAIEDERGRIWYADLYPGFKRGQSHLTGCEVIFFNTPFSSAVSDMVVEEGELYVASGGATESFGYQGSRDGFYVFDRISWTIYNQFNTPAIDATGLLNFYRIAPHPGNDKIYVGTYWGGLLEKDGDTYTVYNDKNSSLQGAVGDTARERITGLAFDDQHNLWISNYIAGRPLSVLKADGTWKSFDFPCSNITEATQIVIDHRGYKWIMLYSKSASIIVYDDNGTIDNEADDRCKVLSATNTEIPSNSMYSMVVDLDGDIWVGTAEGPVVFDGSADIFDNHRGSRIKVEQDGVLNYLFGEETIYTIAVDGANRKWFGTGNGVFVQSPGGDEEVASYNVSNSPLLDNRIYDIAIDNHNGIVYIATAGGIMSLRTDAIIGQKKHDENVYAFPNPVRPDYDGPIAIRGLARDAVVKITNVRGQVLYETRALGGQAIWDGRDLNGESAETGVYLVFSTSGSDGFSKPDALVTRILVVK